MRRDLVMILAVFVSLSVWAVGVISFGEGRRREQERVVAICKKYSDGDRARALCDMYDRGSR